jgi:hypothetical protein
VVRERDKETKEVVKERVKRMYQGRKYLQKKLNKIGTHDMWQREFRPTFNKKYFRLPMCM